MRSAPLLLATLLAFSASVAAHVTTTVDPLTAPLVVGVPTEVTVHFSEPCFEVLPQQAQGDDSVSSGLMPDTAGFTWVGENVPFTADMCDPTSLPIASVKTSAKLTITAGPDAPGLTNLTLQATSYLGGGSTAGEPADFVVQVAYFVNATLTIGTPAGTGATRIVPITVTYSANAPTSLGLGAGATSGTITGLTAKTDLAAPSSLNKTTITKTFNATFASAGAPSTITVTATLTPKAGTGKEGATILTQTLAVPAYTTGNGTDDGHDHTHDESSEPKKTPLPLPVLLVAVGAALAVARRRLA